MGKGTRPEVPKADGARKGRLLSLSHVLPFPPNTGVHTRTYNTWRILAERYQLSALCFHRSEGGRLGGEPAAAVRALQDIAEVRVFSLPQDRSRLRLLGDHASSLLARRVYTVPTYRSRPFRAALMRALRETAFDIVHMETLDLSAFLPLLEDQTVVCTHHNVESDLLVRRAAAEPNSVLRAYMVHQARLMRAEEARWCERIALNIVVSSEDRDRLSAIAPGARIEVVPNGVDAEYFAPRAAGGSGLVFTGGTMYHPNREALEFFAAKVLPLLRDAFPEVPVTWVGRATAEEQQRFARAGIELTGLVEDVRPHLAAAGCFIAPLLTGGGTRLKIMEAWSMGKAVVSTRIGCEGLDARDGQNLLIRDDPESFANAIVEVLRDAALRTRLEAAARETAERLYSWRGVGQGLHAALAGL